jgi:hypothetical protein
MAIFALAALRALVLLSLGVLVLVRYRSAIPLMFALLALDGLAGQLVLLHFVPIVRVPVASIVDLGVVAVMIGGLALSLRRHGARGAQAAWTVNESDDISSASAASGR